MRVVAAVGHLRRRSPAPAVRAARDPRRAPGRPARPDLGIVHLGVQGDHLRLLCEADTKRALARGVVAFEISAARRINDALRVGSGASRGRCDE